MSQLLVPKERLYAVFCPLSKDRNKRQYMVDRPDRGGREPAWVAYERKMMHEAVNRERTERSKKPIDVVEIKRVELLALGHTDYGEKFALYCAELVLQAVTSCPGVCSLKGDQ